MQFSIDKIAAIGKVKDSHEPKLVEKQQLSQLAFIPDVHNAFTRRWKCNYFWIDLRGKCIKHQGFDWRSKDDIVYFDIELLLSFLFVSCAIGAMEMFAYL
mmetsp:Transcript_5551/g.12653  ORF Transcript_5551/g.12653 Transcript_5551/m.12653 type:complete len:100 (+) Transcript_5551:109-408(+)